MNAVFLSRLYFEAAAFFNFLFVPLALGLSILIAITETVYVKSRDEDYKKIAKFWGTLFLINFVISSLGIAIECCLVTNWPNYSMSVKEIFGPSCAAKFTVVFFLESILLGIWVFGWKEIPRKLHVGCIWLAAMVLSACSYWILFSNSFLQQHIGYTIQKGPEELAVFVPGVTKTFASLIFFHTLSGAYVLAAVFVMGISAYHLLKRQQIDLFKKSYRIALPFTLVFLLFGIIQGCMVGSEVAETQPAKLASMASHWETTEHAPMILLSIPDEKNERNRVEIARIPGALSLFAYHEKSAVVVGLRDFPREQRPWVLKNALAFRLMGGLGMIIALVLMVMWLRKNKLEQSPRLLKIIFYAIPLPYLAIEAGWMLTETGRQPWIIYSLMKTSKVVFPTPDSKVLLSLILVLLANLGLGIADFYFLRNFARKGPG